MLGLLPLVLVLALDPAPVDRNYEEFARRADLLLIAADSKLVAHFAAHRRYVHRYTLACERRFVAKPSGASARRYRRAAAAASTATHVPFYSDRAKRVCGLPGRARKRLATAWSSGGLSADGVDRALITVAASELEPRTIEHRPLPDGLPAAIRQLRSEGCPDGALAGMIALAAGRLEQAAFDDARTAIRHAAELDDEIEAGRGGEIALIEGRVALKRDAFRVALDAFARAARLSRLDERHLADAHLAHTHAQLHELGKARALADAAMAGLERLSPVNVPVASLLLAETEARLGAFDRALALNERARVGFERADRDAKRRVLLATRQRGWIVMLMGRLDEAEGILVRGLAVAERAREPVEELYHLRILTDLAARRARPGEALRWGERMLNAAARLRRPKELVTALRLLALVSHRCELHAESTDYLVRAHAAAKENGLHRLRRIAARELVDLLHDDGRANEAGTFEAEIRRGIDEVDVTMRVADRLQLARVARRRGDRAAATRELDRALDDLTTIDVRSPDPLVRFLRAEASIEIAASSEHPADALEALEDAIVQATALQDPFLEASALVLRASVLSRAGRAADARKTLERAVEITGRCVASIGHANFRHRLTEGARDAFGPLADAVFELGSGEEDTGATLLGLAERLRDQRYRVWSAHLAGPKGAERDRLRARMEEVLREVEDGVTDPARRQLLHARLVALRESHDRLVNEALIADAPRATDPTIDVVALQSRLGDALLLEFLIGQDNALLICVGREGVRVFALPVAPAKLAARVRYVDALVQRLNPRTAVVYARATHALYRDLLGPAVDAGLLPEGRPLVFAPDRGLERFPFHALVTRPPGPRDGFGQLRYLVSSHPVRYVTAAADLLTPPRRPSTSPRFLGVAPAPAVTGLPGAIAEIEAIGDLFPASDRTLASGPHATESSLRRRDDLGRYDIVHFATHGRFSPLHAQYCGLLLGRSPDDRTSDGVLRGYEVRELGLRPSLVVLSACSSGRDVADRGTSGVGWGRVFLRAGASSVLLTCWPVADDIAPAVMRVFYRRLLAGARADRALADACRAMIATGDRSTRANPRYWAPFVIVGEAVGVRAGAPDQAGEK